MNLDEPCIDHGQKSKTHGYGTRKHKGKSYRAHVLALMMATGYRPPGLFALHGCDNPRCVNPNHLRWGTHQDNMRERNERGRARGGRLPGELCGKAKLSNAQVMEIRSSYVPGVTLQKDLAIKYGVTTAQICRIVNRKSRSQG